MTVTICQDKAGTDESSRRAADWVKENVDYPYYMIRDRFAGADAQSLRAVKRGQGKIIERNGAKAAVYRDQAGQVSTHLYIEGQGLRPPALAEFGASVYTALPLADLGEVQSRVGVDSRGISRLDFAGSTPPMVPPGTGAVKSSSRRHIP